MTERKVFVKRITALSAQKRLLSLLLCFCTFLCTVGLRTDAAASASYHPDMPASIHNDYRTYSTATSQDITAFNYSAMEWEKPLFESNVSQSAVMDNDTVTGRQITVTTGYNKKFEIHFVPFYTYLFVPAHTTYRVAHNFTMGGTRKVSNKRATAATCFELVYIGSDLETEGMTFSPAVSNTAGNGTVGCNKGKTIFKGYKNGKGSSTEAAIGNQASFSTRQVYTYENTTDEEKIISQWFGIWVAKQYGSKYDNQVKVDLNYTTETVYSTARVTLYKDGKPWENQNVVLKSGSDSYSMTDSGGIYNLETTSVEMTTDKTYRLYVGGEDSNEDLGYDPAKRRKYYTTRTLDFVTVTYDMGDATEGTPPSGVARVGSDYKVKTDCPLSKPGYKQTGWSTKNGGKGVTVITGITQKTTLYPVFEAISATPPAIVSVPKDKTTEYTTAVNLTAGYTIPENHTCTVVWYKCDNTNREGSVLVGKDDSYTTPKTLSVGKHYYCFEVIAKRKDNGLTAKSQSSAITVTVTATKPTVTFNVGYNGGSVTPAKKVVTSDSPYGELPVPTRSGYAFVGWYTANTGGSKVTADTKVSNPADHTLYARWEPTASVSITWGTLDFTYYDGDWDSKTHTYKNGGWKPNKTGGDYITVKNDGAAEVNVTCDYAQKNSEIYAVISSDSFALSSGSSKRVRLVLQTKPNETLDKTEIGTVTVKVR